MTPDGALSDQHDILVPRSSFYHGPYGRMFRNLPPWFPDGRTDTEKIAAIERLAQNMLETVEESDDASLDNRMIPAGYTYFGQFIAHDMTFDSTSYSQRLNDPDTFRYFRTPRLDLDSLYGNGPIHNPFRYDQNRQDRDGFTGFLLIGIGKNEAEEDLPRNRQGCAFISDTRNDENIIISQLQLGLMKFHNQVMGALDTEGIRGNRAFMEAQRLVRWHYQWVIVHDFLRRLVSPAILDYLLTSLQIPPKATFRFYRWAVQPFIPIEFYAAAYCMGYSMVRSSYALNDTLEEIRDNVGVGGKIPILLPPQDNPSPLADLRGGRFLPRLWSIQWNRFLAFQDHDGSRPTLQKSRKLNTKLAFRLGAIRTRPGSPNSLPVLNLMRGWHMGLPSGQHVSRAMGIEPRYNPSGHDPLWYYILQEAALEGGERLGQVGGTIVAEVFMGLLAADPLSYLNMEPTWEPKKEVIIPIAGADDENFQLRDMLRFANVPITKEDIETIIS